MTPLTGFLAGRFGRNASSSPASPASPSRRCCCGMAQFPGTDRAVSNPARHVWRGLVPLSPIRADRHQPPGASGLAMALFGIASWSDLSSARSSVAGSPRITAGAGFFYSQPPIGALAFLASRLSSRQPTERRWQSWTVRLRYLELPPLAPCKSCSIAANSSTGLGRRDLGSKASRRLGLLLVPRAHFPPRTSLREAGSFRDRNFAAGMAVYLYRWRHLSGLLALD